jgi:hypothetical protein
MKYRKIWEKVNGPIPKDHLGRTYEIHHIDGNRKNNDISNLMCVSIEEHYKIHLNQKDYAAACMVAERLDLQKQELDKLYRLNSTTYKKGHTPWNKGKTGVYTEDQLNRIRETTKKSMKGKNIGQNNPMYGKKSWNIRKVCLLDESVVFESSRSAAEYFKVTPSTICIWLKNNNKVKFLK